MGSMFGGGSSGPDYAQKFQRLPAPQLPAMQGQSAVLSAQRNLGADPNAYGQNYQSLVNAMLSRRPGAMPAQAAPVPQRAMVQPTPQMGYWEAMGHPRGKFLDTILGGRNYSYARDGGGFQMDRPSREWSGRTDRGV